MPREEGWNDKELQDKVDGELMPLFNQLKAKCQELGVTGMFFGQVGGLMMRDDGDKEEFGWKMMAVPINAEEFADAIDKFKKENEGIEFENIQQAKETLAKYNLPGPMMLVLLLIQQGKINTEKLLVEAMMRQALAEAIQSDDFGNFEDLMQMMQQGGVRPGTTRRRKQEQGWIAKEDEDGNFLGFINPETGEEDLLN